ncbi:MAG: (2Fe-2S)-binding protein [Chloroflexi bacterium]|nr:(2Fe-2S)-binding protein [Chloroflexota bacterium]
MKRIIELNVNGVVHEVVVEPQRTLLEVLRETLGYTGTKKACDSGDCGACTVIIDGRAVLSCLTLAVEAQGKNIETIEGMATGDRLHPIQQAFLDKGAIQCGYCTPGLVLSAKALLDENPKPSREEVKKAIGGNLCRCTGYVKILDAIEAAGEQAN